jgi:carboxypeptidase C (cathepsin A)
MQSLPYAQPGLHPCSYAGTFLVNDTADHNLFYWYFKHEDPTAPLLLWLNGGPGSSSLFGLFVENGPLRVTMGGGGDQDFLLSPAEKAWTDSYNVIWLDQPVGVGFSYGTPNVDDITMQVGADEFWNFMQAFYVKYPEMKTVDFHMTGESYAGKYIPLLSYTVLTNNKQSPVFEVPLKTSLIIDPFTVPVLQRTSMHLVGQALNILDSGNLDQIATLEQHCLAAPNGNLSAGVDTCNAIMDYIEIVSGNVMPYNSRIFEYDFDPIEAPE